MNIVRFKKAFVGVFKEDQTPKMEKQSGNVRMLKKSNADFVCRAIMQNGRGEEIHLLYVQYRKRKDDDRFHTKIDSSPRPIERGDPEEPMRLEQ